MIALEYISHGLKQKYSGYCGTVLFLMGCTAYFFVVTGLNHYTSFEGALGIGYGVVLYVYCLLAAEGRKSDFFLLSVVWVLLAFISAYVMFAVWGMFSGGSLEELLKTESQAHMYFSLSAGALRFSMGRIVLAVYQRRKQKKILAEDWLMAVTFLIFFFLILFMFRLECGGLGQKERYHLSLWILFGIFLAIILLGGFYQLIGKYRIEKIEDEYQKENQKLQEEQIHNLFQLGREANRLRHDMSANTTNDKNEFENTVWFAIVPDVELNQSSGGKLQRVRFAGNQRQEKAGTNTMENLSILMNAIQPYRITTFFSFQTGEETTFNYVATEGIGVFKEKCTPLMKKEYSEFAVPCIPNATIIPKDKSGLILDRKMVMDEDGNVSLSSEKEDIMKMWLEGIYVGAAYEAAGITAAWQCPEYLKERFHNTSKEYPGVRFDVEADDNALLASTSLTKEISGFTNVIKNSINNTGFGFVFSSDNAQHKGKEIKNITVYKARNLLNNGTQFEPIYKTLVVTYIERMLRFYSGDFKQDKILKFFSSNPNSQKSRWDADRQHINSILQDGDELDYTIDEKYGICNVMVTFANTTRNLKVQLIRKAGEKSGG